MFIEGKQQNNNTYFPMDLEVDNYKSSSDIMYLCEFTINVPIDVPQSTYLGPNMNLLIVNNKTKSISSPGLIALDNTIYDLKHYTTKYGVIWGQLFFPTKTPLANLAVQMFNFAYEFFEWEVIFPFNYYYVNTKKQGADNPIPKKGFTAPPFLEVRGINPAYDLPEIKKKSKDRQCKDPYKRLDYDGFNFALERDNKLLIGNYLYDKLEIIFDYSIKEKKGVFIGSRKASDLGALSNSTVEVVESKVNKKVTEKFDIEKFSLEGKDFHNMISEKNLKSINKMIKDGVDKVVNSVPAVNGKKTIESLIESYPQYAEEIKTQVDNTRDISDMYIWNNVPTKRPLDFILGKKIHIKEQGGTFVRKKKDK